MNDLRAVVTAEFLAFFEAFTPSYANFLFHVTVLAWVTLCAVVLHLILHKIIVRVLTNFNFVDQEGSWLSAFHEFKLLHYMLLIFQTAFVQIQVNAWLEKDCFVATTISSFTNLLIAFFGLMSIFAVLNSFQSIMNSRVSRLHIPIRGAIQTSKLIMSILFGLIAVAIILGKSLLVLLSGIGALSAVMMLVFKDPLLGLAAGVQLSVNDMLRVGDWLEMPKYNADGDVIDIGLTTVKVQNFDKTITTVPTYALISDSFKNWRGMSEAGGRRIKRSLLINTSSIKFLNEKDIEHLKKSKLLVDYLEDTTGVLQKENEKLGADMASMINGRRLTNIGTFRRYLLSYLKSHPKTRNDMSLMVRQLAFSSEGLPIEIYVFTNTTVWAEYEDIQSDIFDHIFAVLGEFELKVHESPIGEDIKQIVVKSSKEPTE